MKDNFDRTMNFWRIGLSQWFWDTFIEKPAETVTVRARNKKGHYVSDDPTTEQNEAYTTAMRRLNASESKAKKKKTKSKKKTSTLMHP
jgi:hypothetical protein